MVWAYSAADAFASSFGSVDVDISLTDEIVCNFG